MFKKIGKGLSTLLNIDGIISLLQKGAILWSLFGMYVVTLLQGFEDLPQVWQWMFLLAAYLMLLCSILVTVFAIKSIRKWLNSRVRKNIGLSIAWSRELAGRLADDENASLWRVWSAKDHVGAYMCTGISSTLQKVHLKDSFIPKIVLTNHSETPIFKLEIPVHVDIGIKDEDNKHYKVVHSEDMTIFPFKKESIKPNESLDIYIGNSSKEYAAILNLLGYIECNIFDSDQRVKIKYTWEGRRPLKIELETGGVL